jgi:hypothetical protein
VLNQKNQLIEQSCERYNIKVLHFDIIGITDNIFEPGELINIKNINIINTGGLTLPEGCVLTFSSPILLESKEIHLKSLKPKEEINLSDQISCRIIDRKVSEKSNLFDIRSTVKLLDRTFEDSILVKKIKVEYPIVITEMESPKEIGKGEEGILKFKISNISSISYGSETTHGDIEFKIIHDERIKPKENFALKGSIPLINSGDFFTKEIEFNLDKWELEFYEKVEWSIELYLRGKLIEKQFQKIKVFPSFVTPNPQDDILFITDSEMLQDEFLIYISIFEGLGLQYNVWDISNYNGKLFHFSNEIKGISFDEETKKRHENTWVDKYRGKCIFYPISIPEDMKKLSSKDILSHFKEGEEDFDSGIVFIAESTPKQILHYLFQDIEVSTFENEEFCENFIIGEPDSIQMKSRALSNFNYILKERNNGRYSLQISKSHLYVSWK